MRDESHGLRAPPIETGAPAHTRRPLLASPAILAALFGSGYRLGNIFVPRGLALGAFVRIS